ncbi:MAG TPA: hypothetical protein VGF67_04940 [Ktedonobacteraceae bacterium]|jgi:hypothetical protein
MFKFSKKHTEAVAPVLEEVSEDQLGQVTGGADGNGMFNLLGGVTGLTTQQLNSVSVSEMRVQVGGFCIETPEITPTSLLP